MKKLLVILFLGLFLITPTQADDIRDFEIEGMSIGDSALDFFTKEQIKDSQFKMFKSDAYTTFVFYNSDYETYDAVEIVYKKNDKKFIIVSISGGIQVHEEEMCLKKKDTIVENVKIIFPNSQSMSDEGSHPVDTTGKSKFYRTAFQVSPNSKYFELEVSCIFYRGEISNEYSSNVGITLRTDDFIDWVTHEAY